MMSKEYNMRVFSISSQKGGTGKTSTVAALATGATHRGLRTLCIDLDPQGSLTTVLRGRPDEGNSYQTQHGHTCHHKLFLPL